MSSIQDPGGAGPVRVAQRTPLGSSTHANAEAARTLLNQQRADLQARGINTDSVYFDEANQRFSVGTHQRPGFPRTQAEQGVQQLLERNFPGTSVGFHHAPPIG